MIYGIGIDLVDTVRMEGVIKRWGGRFTHKVFTTREIAYCEQKRSPASHYAVRFAAKESFFKALGRAQGKGIRWKEVEVMGKGDEPPSLDFSGVTERRIKALGVRRVLLSLSHGAGLGVAQVILEG
jgi:holo-[acyl-carrier protein] synthase